MGRRRRRRWLAAAMAVVLAVPANLQAVLPAKAAEKQQVFYEDIRPFYLVDCGDFDVTTPPEGEDFGTYQSVTEQVYGEDARTGYAWGIVDDYGVEPPEDNKQESNGKGIRTDWTWAHENGGWTVDSPKTSTNRYTKNQYENRATFGEERKLDYAFALPEGTYDVETLCVDPWNVSTHPTAWLNYGKGDQTQFEDFAVNQVRRQRITLDGGGELTVNFRGTGDTLAVNTAYIQITDAKYQGMYECYRDLKVANRVTADFVLPQSGNASVSWRSDNSAIEIQGDQAVVTRSGSDQEVVLTAEISNEEYKVEKEFHVTVPAENGGESGAGIRNFPNEAVTVTDSYYQNSYDREVDYLLSLDVDRLLAGFRETAAYAAGYGDAERAAFMKQKTRYDGWENTNIGGHTGGHYMSAIAQAYCNPDADEEQKRALLDKINAIADGLKECQEMTKGSEACKEGFLFGATIQNTRVLESQFNQYDGQGTGSSDWVAWYTMHKILAGLVDLYKYADNETALEVAVNLGLWVYNRADQWSEAVKQKVLNVEYGGMNDALYELYACIEARDDYRQYCPQIRRAAEQFDEVSLFETVAKGGANVLDGRHANTTIPKFIGALKRYMVLGEGEERYLEYAEKFWEMVVAHHTYVTGGNSENEHFGRDDILYGERTTVNCETCNTYNMLKLTRELFKITGDRKYADYYENTLINAIMSSQNPETGMSMYFQPMATGYQKVFGKPYTDFWCCTGSGMENFVKLNDSIYFHMDDSVIVNQYLSSDLVWEEKNVKLTQTSGIQDLSSEQSEIRVEAVDPGQEASVDIALRIPDWVADQGNTMMLTLNGEPVPDPEGFDFEGKAGGASDAYYVVHAQAGDVITVHTPMEAVAYNLPDGNGKDTYAFKYGPVMLSAKIGHDPAYQTEASHGIMVRRASTSAVTSERIGIYDAESVEEYMANINDNLVRTTGATFRLRGANCNYDFVPHYSQYTDNYGIYWTYYVGEKDSDSIISEKDINRKNRVIVDSLQAGYGQYEPGLDTGTGNVGSSLDHTRYAEPGGYFEYEIKVDGTETNDLLLTLRREDDGKPLKVSAGGAVLYETQSLDSGGADVIQGMLSDSDFERYYQIRIEIPQDVADTRYQNSQGDDVVRFRFEGTDAKASACLYNWQYCVRKYADENHLKSLKVNGTAVDLRDGSYTLNLPGDADTFSVEAEITDNRGYVAVDGKAIEENRQADIPVTGYSGTYQVQVFAENFEKTEEVRLIVNLDTSSVDFSGHIKRYYSFDGELTGAVPVQKATVPSPTERTAAYTDGAAETTGKALAMDGTYGLALGDAAELGESYTISYWMKPDQIGKDVDPTFCAGVFDPEYWLSATFDAKIWSRKSGYIATPAANCYRQGTWQYVTIVVDGERAGTQDGTVTGTLYVNGEAVSEGDVAAGVMTAPNAALYFGVNRWDAYFKGAVDELLLLDVALKPKDISAFMDGSIGADGFFRDGVKYGDINRDSQVTAVDALLLLNGVVGGVPDAEKEIYDVNRDGSVDVKDVEAALRLAADRKKYK